MLTHNQISAILKDIILPVGYYFYTYNGQHCLCFRLLTVENASCIVYIIGFKRPNYYKYSVEFSLSNETIEYVKQELETGIITLRNQILDGTAKIYNPNASPLGLG